MRTVAPARAAHSVTRFMKLPPCDSSPHSLVPLDHLSIQHCENMLSTFRLVVARPQQTNLQLRRPQTAVARCYAAILAVTSTRRSIRHVRGSSRAGPLL